MLYIRSLREGLPVFKALGSSTRVAIMELLIEKGPMRMTAIAQQLGITGGALTSHVKELTDAGLIYIETTGGKHGLQKICHAYDRRILVEAAPMGLEQQIYQHDLPVGGFAHSDVTGASGLARREGPLEPQNSPEAFASSDRERAGLVWFSEGSLVYRLATPLEKGDKALELNISLELASFAPDSTGKTGADVTLAINDTPVATWAVALGRTGDRNPHSWWQPGWPQHGHLCLVSINSEGTYVDGKRVSAVKATNLALEEGDIRIAVSSKPRGRRSGGLMIFGRDFGHHEQDINTLLKYRHGKQK